MKHLQEFSTQTTPQSEPIPGTDQIKNSAGGYTWGLDPMARLHRFLVLGTEGGSYYASERKLTRENAQVVLDLIAENRGHEVVDMVVGLSTEGRVIKNDTALFALAMVAAMGSPEEKTYAYEVLPKVARIGTHLFQFMTFYKQFGTFSGSGLRRALQRWYLERSSEQLAYQLAKYQSRHGWTHADVLRLAKPKVPDGSPHDELFAWAVGKGEAPENSIMEGMRLAQEAKDDPKAVAGYVTTYGLTREMVPTEALSSPEVWEALLHAKMPLGAMLRNLANMTRVGLLTSMSDMTPVVIKKLTDMEALKKARIHPIQVMVALRTYASGRSARGRSMKAWHPIPRITAALEEAFNLSFGAVEPSGKRTLLALDVSGSMGYQLPDTGGMTCREGSSIMAMVTARVEEQWDIIGFTGGGFTRGSRDRRFGAGVTRLKIDPSMSLRQITSYTQGLPFGGTDCALPMLWAEHEGIPVDTFVVYTDNETWVGGIHPAQALQKYRKQMGIDAKLAVVGMVSNGFTIADPNDPGMLDFVGFDTATPQALSEFSRA